ncbi:MAG: sugar phosphate isomerase/epimerase family protein [Verrucomicrobiota bacterium]
MKKDSSTRRRDLIRAGAILGLSLPLMGRRVSAEREAVDAPLFTQMGINAGLNRAAAVAAEGADFLLVSVNKCLIPNAPEAEFEKQLQLLEESPIPVLSCNGFLQGETLRSIGPNARVDNILRFAAIACQRAKRAGVERIVFGSSGSRKLPEGWTKEQADEAFIPLLKKLGDVAGDAGIVITVENLRKQECNYLTRLAEVGEIVTKTDHPHIRMLADLYHGSVMEDPPEVLEKYAHLVDIVEIAEAKGRTIPGVGGQDFGPYFEALRRGGYRGPIEIEGKWKIGQVAKAFATIRQQSA